MNERAGDDFAAPEDLHGRREQSLIGASTPFERQCRKFEVITHHPRLGCERDERVRAPLADQIVG